jgi:photosystem II stability/assembly factor-like uncharacterized protein
LKTFLQTLVFFLLLTQISFAQWMQLGLDDKGIKDIAARNSTIFAVTSDSGIVYRSTDDGINWLQIVESRAIDIAISQLGRLFMVKEYSPLAWEDSLYRSSDNGNTWVNLNIMEQLPGLYGYPTYITISPVGFVFCRIFNAAMMDSGTLIALSTDDGLTWTSPGGNIYGGDLFDFKGHSVITSGFESHTHGRSAHVYLSSDDGQTWLEVGSPPNFDNNVLSMCLNGNILIGASGFWGSGLFLSSDTCNTWTQVNPLNIEAGLSIESGGMLVGTDSLGIFLFSDNGDSLGSRNEGLTNLNIQSLTLDNNGYVYAGTGIGIWRRPLSEIITSAEEVYTQPTEFILEQNFPNPFNPVTTIKYSIPEMNRVTLNLFNLLGEEVAILVNEEKVAGYYTVEFNAAALPSGVYFYQLKAGEYVQTKKMLLLK